MNIHEHDNPPPAPSRVCIFGAATGSGHNGVVALRHALLDGLYRRDRSLHVTVFDNERGTSEESFPFAGSYMTYTRCGVTPTARFFRPDRLLRARVAGFLGSPSHPVLAPLRAADAVLDASGGDGFTDRHGGRRFRAVLTEKRLALGQGAPLILLPQAIGPFARPAHRLAARDVVAQCAMVWAQDEHSLDALRDLLGCQFDERRHRLGVDLAFGLPARMPAAPLPAPIPAWLDDGRQLAVVNVSGPLWNEPAIAGTRHGLTIDYRVTVTRLVQRLAEVGMRILFLPLVVTHPGHVGDDVDACRAALEASGAGVEAAILPEGLGPAETKWIVSRCGWCCATRMHAAIAGLSAGVPTTGIAYSSRMRGPFATCGLEGHVTDGRWTTTGDAIERLWRCFEERADARAQLEHSRPGVLARADAQLDAILGCVHLGRAALTGTRAA